jgi:hypothetical protein
MISLINFDSDVIVQRSEAEDLGLHYIELVGKRIGYKDNKLQTMSPYDHYTDDSTPKNIAGEFIDKKGEVISPYYLYSPVPANIDINSYVLVKSDGHMVDLVKFLPKCKYTFKVVKTVPTMDTPVNNLHYVLNTLEDKLEAFSTNLEKIQKTSFNTKCNVHVGGGMIATFNDITLKENCCSDELQVELNNGWRMLAVCVQPDQRRPDYILGYV